MEARHPYLIATNLTYEQLAERANACGNDYFDASYAGGNCMLCHITPAGKLVDYAAKPLRKRAKYDWFEYMSETDAVARHLLQRPYDPSNKL
jgi:hypothetical protein